MAGKQLLEDFGGKLRYAIPAQSVSLSVIFRALESVRDEYCIVDYALSQTT